MPHLQVIHHRPPTRWGRLKESVRSLRLGPWGLKDPRLREFFGGAPTYAGVAVGEDTALTYAAVWQAVTLIAGDIASLPLLLYKRDSQGGKTRYTEHPLYELLHTAPNPEMSSMTVRETLQAHALTWGNGYAEIERDGGARPVGLWPLLPTQVQPHRERGRLLYRVTNPDGRHVEMEPANMLHLHGLGFDGTQGYSVIRQARQSLGLLAASERFGATFFGNGATFGGAVKHPKVLGDAAVKNLRESINSYHQGADKAHRFLILEEGADYIKFGVDPNDAQFLETRQFQIAEVARWFNLPLHKLREMEHSSVRANIEQEALDYYTATLRPWLVRWEQELNRKLVSPRERNIQHIEHNLDGVLRGDLKSRYDAYAVGRQWGWLSQNEIRALENLGPIPDGDKYLSPMNMVPSDRLDEVIDKQVEPTPPPQPPQGAAPAEDDDEDARALTALLERLEAQATTIGEWQARHEALVATLANENATTAALRTELDASERERHSLAATFDNHRRESARLFDEHSNAGNAALADLTTLVATREAERDALSAECERLSSGTKTLEAERDTAHAATAAVRADLESVRAELATTVAKWLDSEAAASATLESVRGDLATSDAERRRVEREQDSVRADLESVRAELVTVRDTSAAAVAELQARAEAAEAKHAADELRAVEATELAAIADEVSKRHEAVAARAAADAQAAVALAEDAERARAAAEADAASLRERQAAVLVAVSTAARAVVEATVARLVRREAEKARSKRATPEKLRTWAESFYEAHEAETWTDALRPVVALHQALLGSARDADTVAAALVAEHFGTSKRQIVAAAAVDPEEFDAAVTATLNRWETTRATAVADAFVREEMLHVRT